MIRLTDTPYDIEGSYNKQKDLLEPSLLILKSMKKPLIEDLIKDANKDKIEFYTKPDKEHKDPRILIPNKDMSKVKVNLSYMVKDIERASENGTIPVGELYSYLLQAYVLLHGNELIEDRDLLKILVSIYVVVIRKIFAINKADIFKNREEMAKMDYLLARFILLQYKIDSVNDQHAFASKLTYYPEADAINDTYADYFEPGIDFNTYFENVLLKEFSFLKHINPNDIGYLLIKYYGPTGAMILDDMRYILPLIVDTYAGRGRPLVYKQYSALIKLIKPNDVHILSGVLFGL